MRFLARLTVPSLAAASLLIAACGSSYSSPSTTASKAAASTTSASTATVKTASTSLGKVLVDGQGMTLYALSVEKNGHFICTASACTGVWHPLTVSAGAKPTGEVAALGTVKRPDGTTQVTYKGAPLYTFASDSKPGETRGQGFKDVGTWSVVTVGSAAPAAPSQTTTQGETSSGGGAYHY